MLAHAGAADEGLAIAMVFAGLWVGWIGRARLKGTGFRRVPRPVAGAALVLAAGLLVASTIVPRAIFPTRTNPTPTGVAAFASTATLSFVRPSEGTTVTGDELELVMRLEGGRVVDTSGPVTPDTGHIHVSIDGTLVSMTYGTVQVLDLTTFGPGLHTLRAEFVAADHRSFTPPVVATRTFARPTI